VHTVTGTDRRRALVWFRSDLRVRDNPALFQACEQHRDGVVAAFLPSPGQWRRHDWSPWKVDLLRRSLVDLRGELAARGIPLRLRTADTFAAAPAAIVALAKAEGCATIWCNVEHEVNERMRDDATTALAAGEGIDVRRCLDQVLVDPSLLQSGSGRPFQAYTPFKNACLRHLATHGLPRLFGEPPPVTRNDAASDAVPESFAGFAAPAAGAGLWPAGELAAQRRLQRFCDRGIADYSSQRDVPAVPGTSLLSPYLALGVVAVRRCVEAARVHNRGRLSAGDIGPDTWIQELLWREFYRHVLVHWPAVCRGRAFQPATEQVAWRDDDAGLQAWRAGHTGFPIVDAAMRCLLATGFMHNRLRMVVAQFLAKDLLLDWRAGERHFSQQLVDLDFANNNGGWQWSASTGSDAVPYFRIFNPTTQGERCDPDGEFVRRWVPELAAVGADELHDPPAAQRQARGYAMPIVDHAAARARALAAFKAIGRGASRR
jgi:deoxyribodipyrimidine photo-lyase